MKIIVVPPVLFLSTLIIFSVRTAQTQSFYPLEIGNRWDFSDTSWGSPGGGIRETTSVSVVADTVMANGLHYSVFAGEEPSGGLFVRVDSNWIYYFDSYQTFEDVPFYKLSANIGEQWDVALGRWFIVTYDGDYAASMFGVPVTVKQYHLDGLAIAGIWISDRFGPIAFWDQYDPPGLWNTYRSLIGAITADTVYGTIVSVDDEPSLPQESHIAQNFPNPFNSTTNIRFTLRRRSSISLTVYDILGRELAIVASGVLETGVHVRQWNADRNPSGVYFYRLQTSDFVETKPMVLLR